MVITEIQIQALVNDLWFGSKNSKNFGTFNKVLNTFRQTANNSNKSEHCAISYIEKSHLLPNSGW